MSLINILLKYICTIKTSNDLHYYDSLTVVRGKSYKRTSVYFEEQDVVVNVPYHDELSPKKNNLLIVYFSSSLNIIKIVILKILNILFLVLINIDK